ncbi:hypothetical protein BJ912DRAFT_991542 [Pholiota molesta]|nr:hypothetical protein BJ912DRAFT_991542 [Pholiota molesta]
MFINLIIDSLLPMQSRLASSIPRARCAAPSLKRASRGYANSLSQDAASTSSKIDPSATAKGSDRMKDHPVDISSEYLHDARLARANANNYSIDAASPNNRPDPRDRTGGNPEGMGMLEQVGSASATAKFFADGGKQGVKT